MMLRDTESVEKVALPAEMHMHGSRSREEAVGRCKDDEEEDIQREKNSSGWN